MFTDCTILYRLQLQISGVDQIGLKGGLALLWRNDVNLQIISFSSSHIDTVIFHEEKVFLDSQVFIEVVCKETVQNEGKIRNGFQKQGIGRS